MAINFTRLATGWGKLAGALVELNTFRGGTIDARVATIRAAVTVDTNLNDNLTENAATLAAGTDSWVQALATEATGLLVAEVKDDVNLADLGTQSCLTELVRQMTVASESFATARCTASTAQITGSSDVTVVTDFTDPNTGANTDYAVPDAMLIEAVSTTGFSVLGLAAVLPQTNADWPIGVGISTFMSLYDIDVGSGDPGFESWTSATVATYWTTVAGTIDRVSGDPYGGTSLYVCGMDLTDAIKQTTATTRFQPYLLTAWVKKTATGANTGAVTLSLRTAGGTLIGTAKTIAMSGLTTSWVLYQGVTVPTVDATDSTLNVVCTLGAGDVVNVSGVQAIPLVPLYTRGPSLTLLRGINYPAINDTWRTTVVATGSLTGSLLRGVDRLIGLADYPVSIPTSGAPTQADALVS